MFLKQDIINLAQQVHNMLKIELEKMPYPANVLEELHANENAHSRILRMLLQYSGGQNWPVYKSFLNLIKKRCPSASILQCYSPIFDNEKERIDLLIRDSFSDKRTAIIIENKVRGAVDQEQQIERYIKSVEDKGISTSAIYAVYLTANGEKKVSGGSLTKTAKEKLDYSEKDKGRFVELNYRYDILPWIEEDVLPNIALKEDLLASSLKLYVDYLKGMFDLRNDEQIIHQKIQHYMTDKLEIESLQKAFQVMDEINTLQIEVFELVRNQSKRVFDEHFRKPTNVFLSQFGGNVSELEYVSPIMFGCNIDISAWEKTRIRISPELNVGIYGICYKPGKENDPVDENDIVFIQEKLGKARRSIWWPYYKTLDKLDDSAGSKEIWKSIENGNFYKSFEQWLRDVLDITKDLNM